MARNIHKGARYVNRIWGTKNHPCRWRRAPYAPTAYPPASHAAPIMATHANPERYMIACTACVANSKQNTMVATAEAPNFAW